VVKKREEEQLKAFLKGLCSQCPITRLILKDCLFRGVQKEIPNCWESCINNLSFLELKKMCEEHFNCGD